MKKFVIGGIGLFATLLGLATYFIIKKGSAAENVPAADAPGNLGADISKYKQPGEPERIWNFWNTGSYASPIYVKELPWSKKMFITISNTDGSVFWNSMPYPQTFEGLIYMTRETRGSSPVWKSLLETHGLHPMDVINFLDTALIPMLRKNSPVFNGVLDHIYEGSPDIEYDKLGDSVIRISSAVASPFWMIFTHDADIAFLNQEGKTLGNRTYKSGEFLAYNNGMFGSGVSSGSFVSNLPVNWFMSVPEYPIFLKQINPPNNMGVWESEKNIWRAAFISIPTPPVYEGDKPGPSISLPGPVVPIPNIPAEQVVPSVPVTPPSVPIEQPVEEVAPPALSVSRPFIKYGCFKRVGIPSTKEDRSIPNLIIVKRVNGRYGFFDVQGNDLFDYRLGKERPPTLQYGQTWMSPLFKMQLYPNVDMWVLKRFVLRDRYSDQGLSFEIVKTEIGMDLFGWASHMYDFSQKDLLLDEIRRNEAVWNTRCGVLPCIRLVSDFVFPKHSWIDYPYLGV